MSPLQSLLTPPSSLGPQNALLESPQTQPINRFWSFLQRVFICSARRRSISEETSSRFSPEVCKEIVRREMEELQQKLETHIESLSNGHRRSACTDNPRSSPDIFQEITNPNTAELSHIKIERQIEDIQFKMLKLILQKQDWEYAKFTGTSRKPEERRNEEVNETELSASYDQICEIYNALKMILFLEKRLQLLLQSTHPRNIQIIPHLRELINLNKSLLQELRTNLPGAQTKIHQIQNEISQIQNQNFSGHWMGEGPFSEILDNSHISKWCYDPERRYRSFLDNPFLALASNSPVNSAIT